LTFYNVISAILFMAAFQATIQLWPASASWYAATLVLIMCNEAILTSELLEGQAAVTYKLEMKFLDLLTFFLLSYTLIVIRPEKNAFSEARVALWGVGSPVVFFGALGAYWRLTLSWNRLAGQDDEKFWPKEWLQFSRSLWIVFAVAAVGLLLADAATLLDAGSFDAAGPYPGMASTVLVLVFMVGKLRFRKSVKVEPICKFQSGAA
jgi:hypothetical protein